MSTEGELYRDNVPHGDNVIAYEKWTNAAHATITVTTGTSNVVYISGIDFIIDDAATIDTDGFTIADSGSEIDDIVVDDLMKLVTLADKQTLKFMKVDATNEALVGEIRFTPPVTVAASGTFTITPGETFAITEGAVGVHLAVRGWEDAVENA